MRTTWLVLCAIAALAALHALPRLNWIGLLAARGARAREAGRGLPQGAHRARLIWLTFRDAMTLDRPTCPMVDPDDLGRIRLPLIVNPTPGRIMDMATEKVSLTLDRDLVRQARARGGRRGLSAFVDSALRLQLQHERLRALLDEMDAEHGPIPEDVLEAVRREWPGKPRKHTSPPRG
jgi:hypothetical protein